MAGLSSKERMTLEQMRDVVMKVNQQGGKPTGQVVGQFEPDDDGKYKLYDTTIDALGKDVTEHAIKNLKPTFIEVLSTLTAEGYAELARQLEEATNKTHAELLELANQARPIEISYKEKKKELKGVQHEQFENLLRIVGAKQPVLLVGPAGTGKSHAGEAVAETLDLPFHAISVGSQTSKSDLIGYLTATGTYIRTQFREAYEHGGVFLLDEADAGNSNVLILLNAALSNGQMAFPDGMVKAHEDFRMIGTANTYGNGASRQYVGRNQLDAATLDRFAVLDWNIDDKIEQSLAGTSADGKRWYKVVKAVRKKVQDELELRVVISPRATQRGAKLLAAGLGFDDVLRIALTGNIPASSRKEVDLVAKTAWGK